MRLIDLDALLKFPIRIDKYDTDNGDIRYVYGIEAVIEYAEHLPTVDAVPVEIINEMIDRYQNYLDDAENGDDGWADTCVKSMTALQILLMLWAERKEE